MCCWGRLPTQQKKVQLLGQKKPVEAVPLLATQAPEGSGVDCLFVHNWELHDKLGACDAVKGEDQKGLFCQKELSRDLHKCAVPGVKKKMMLRHFRERAPTCWDEDECDEMFDFSEQ